MSNNSEDYNAPMGDNLTTAMAATADTRNTLSSVDTDLHTRYTQMLNQFVDDGLYDMAYRLLKTTLTKYNIRLMVPPALQKYCTVQLSTLHEHAASLATELSDFTAFSQQFVANTDEFNQKFETNHIHSIIDDGFSDTMNDTSSASSSSSPSLQQSISSSLMVLNVLGRSPSNTIGVITALTADSRYIAVFDGQNGILIYHLDRFFPNIPTTTINTTTGGATTTTRHMNMAQQPKEIERWSIPRHISIRAMKWHPIDNILFVLGNNGTIMLFTFHSSSPVYIRDIDNILCFDIHPSGKFLVYTLMDSPLIKLYDLTTFTCYIPSTLHTLCEQHDGMLQSLQKGELSMADHVPYMLTHLPAELSQQPIISIQYSNFGAYFAVLCFNNNYVSKQHYVLDAAATSGFPTSSSASSALTSTTTSSASSTTSSTAISSSTPASSTSTNQQLSSQNFIPIASIRIYHTADHSLLHTLELPLNDYIIQLLMANKLQQFPNPNTPNNPAANPTMPNAQQFVSYDAPVQPTSLIAPHTSYNHYPPLLDLQTLPISIQWSPNDKFLTCSLYIQPHIPTLDPVTGAVSRSLVATTPYYTPTNVVFLYNVATNSLANTYTVQPPLTYTTQQIMKKHSPDPQPGNIFPYTGFTSFFSKDSQYIFIPSYPNMATIPVVLDANSIPSLHTSSYMQVFNTATGEFIDIVPFTGENEQQFASNPGEPPIVPIHVCPDSVHNNYYVFTVTGNSYAMKYHFVNKEAYLSHKNTVANKNE